ncbi:MAG TPA: cytochrome c oxidase assembly protein [Streptosporangiaceae bacterium]|nr:cytochrome c oxidase assembly protein [Streptosporangiaceae bacterium]
MAVVVMNVVVSHWSANAAVLAVAAVAVAVHALGLRGMAVDARRQGEDTRRGMGWEAAAFYGGLLVVILALLSPLAYWSARYIWVRSLQDVLLANVAPVFLALGAPWLALRRGLPFRRPPAADAGRPRAADAVPRPLAGRVRLAVGTVIAFNVAWCGWHLPPLYDAALRYPVVYAAEVVSYLGLGVAFWLVLIGSRPVSPVLPPLRRVMLLAGTVVVGTLLGMVLVFGSGVAYPSYLGAGRHLISVVYDQQTGGAVLWVLVLPVYVSAGVALLIRWLKDEEAQALTSGLDRLLKPAKPAWPSRSGL